jgi:branched-subunit amino acid transport protein
MWRRVQSQVPIPAVAALAYDRVLMGQLEHRLQWVEKKLEAQRRKSCL